jgi:hypothetical protein
MDGLTLTVIYLIGIFVAIGFDFLYSYLYNKYCIESRDITVSDIVEEMSDLFAYICSWGSVLYFLCGILIISSWYLKKYTKRKIGNKVISKK